MLREVLSMMKRGGIRFAQIASELEITEDELRDLFGELVRMGYVAEARPSSIACGDHLTCVDCHSSGQCDPDRLPKIYELTEKGERIASRSE